MIGIIFATEEEALPFLRRYERGRFEGLTEGETQHDHTVLVSLTGTGKIKATLRTERLLQSHRPRLLLHTGTCTALKSELAAGTLVAVAQVFEGDRVELAMPAYPRMPLEVPFPDLRQATLITQDHTVEGKEERSYWQRIADVTDMCGYAIAYVAATHGVPCHIVKVVTGQVQGEAKHFRQNLSAAHETMTDFLLRAVDRLSV